MMMTKELAFAILMAMMGQTEAEYNLEPVYEVRRFSAAGPYALRNFVGIITYAYKQNPVVGVDQNPEFFIGPNTVYLSPYVPNIVFTRENGSIDVAVFTNEFDVIISGWRWSTM